MIELVIFMAFTAAILIAPIWAFNNARLFPLWKFMEANEKGRKLAAAILSLVVIAFHIVYYAAFPNDTGIMVSTIYVFFSLSLNLNVKLLTFVRAHLKTFCYCSPVIVVLMCIPHMQSTAITMVCIFNMACLFPSNNFGADKAALLEALEFMMITSRDDSTRSILAEMYETYYQKKFTETYFSRNNDTNNLTSPNHGQQKTGTRN